MDLDLHAERVAAEYLPPVAQTSPATIVDEVERPQLPSAGIGAALRVLEHAANALRQLADELACSGTPSFIAALDLLSACRGRVIVTGMGKSGLIGRKIAATLASTGRLAHFVHPAEASHGDLGMIASDDVVLALSNSGETPELADLLAYVTELAIPLIAVTSRAGSTLARRADVLLLLPDAPEACALGMAPTTSTSLMLALGDALAVALMERQGFAPSDFRLRHPGGRLGRRLARVEDLIEGAASLPLVHLDAQMSEVILVMGRTGYGSAGVIDDHGHLIGMITGADMRRHMGPDLLTLRAGDIMTAIEATIRPETSPAEALRTMTALQLSNLFVTEGARPIGILHIDDCRRADAA